MKRTVTSLVLMMSVLAISAQTMNGPILGGELSNSAATSLADIDEVIPRMRALGLNTVLVPAYWELKADGNSIVFQPQCAAGRPESILGTYATYP